MLISAPAKDDVFFAARMTNAQFAALACRLSASRVLPELAQALSSRSAKRGALADEAEIAKWLVNGWSTERLLRTNAALLDGDALRHSLHWAFPQAYYAVFAVAQAYFRAVGYTEAAHASTIKKFGMEVQARRYPPSLSFYADGSGVKSFAGLCCTRLQQSLDFNPEDADTVDGQIAQFLGATRDLDLDSKKADYKFKTKAGLKRKVLRPADWETVSQGLGPTSLLSLLYRKRIKANYRDIDTFLHPELHPGDLYKHLLCIVGALNVTHEAMISAALGRAWMAKVMASVPRTVGERPEKRMSAIVQAMD